MSIRLESINRTGRPTAPGRRPQLSTIANNLSDQPNRPVLLPFEAVQRGMLWILIASSWFVFIEPSPYEFLFILALLIHLPGGMTATNAMMPLIVFLLLYNLGGVFSVLPHSGSTTRVLFVLTSIYMAVSGLFFAFITARSPIKTISTISHAYIATAVIAALCGVLGYFDVAGLAQYFAPESRAAATFKDGNVFGSYLILPCVLLIHGLVTGRQPLKLLPVAALAILLAAIFLAFSRGAWVVLIFATTFSLGLTFLVTPSAAFRGRIVLYSIGVCIAVACAIVMALSIEEVQVLFVERAKLIQTYDVGESGRFGRQLKGIPTLFQSPNGLGPFGFQKLFGQDPHNVYINAFSAYGWLGGFSYLLLIAATLYAGWRTVFTATPWQPFAIALVATLFASILQGLQIDTDHWRHFYLQLGVLWGLYAATVSYPSRQDVNPGMHPTTVLPQQGR